MMTIEEHHQNFEGSGDAWEEGKEQQDADQGSLWSNCEEAPDVGESGGGETTMLRDLLCWFNEEFLENKVKSSLMLSMKHIL